MVYPYKLILSNNSWWLQKWEERNIKQILIRMKLVNNFITWVKTVLNISLYNYKDWKINELVNRNFKLYKIKQQQKEVNKTQSF